MFRLRRGSRDRAASASHAAPDEAAAAADGAGPHMNSGARPSHQDHHQHPLTSHSTHKDTQFSSDMARPVPRPGGADRAADPAQQQKHWSLPSGMDSPALGGDAPVLTGGVGGGARAASSRQPAPVDGPIDPAPDILTRAFHEALSPYTERIRRLETDLARAQHAVSTLEAEKAGIHNWIDRRGLRPDLPPELAGYFAASPVAAGTLAAQLERKMTMLNYSLHQLGDVLPSPPPASTVTSALAALLPSIAQLAALPGGPAGAFEALIKLAGNLNSHGTGDETEADRLAIARFYDQLDDTMGRVVAMRSRAAEEGAEEWDLSRDLERLQRTGAFLKKEMGVRNYFVRSQEAMRGDVGAQAVPARQRPSQGGRQSMGGPAREFEGEER